MPLFFYEVQLGNIHEQTPKNNPRSNQPEN